MKDKSIQQKNIRYSHLHMKNSEVASCNLKQKVR